MFEKIYKNLIIDKPKFTLLILAFLLLTFGYFAKYISEYQIPFMCAANKWVSLPAFDDYWFPRLERAYGRYYSAVSKCTGGAKAVKMYSKDPTLSSFLNTPGVSKWDAENNHYPARFCVSLRSG